MRDKKNKTPWPTKEAMEQVYQNNLWGGNPTEFYSGEGSHDPRFVVPYVDKVISFLASCITPITICDLGCGDFNIGSQFMSYVQKYYGIDIVTPLIEFNQKKYKHEHLEFHCLDIAKDELPEADCVIVRQVLQHLSNAEIKKVVNKLYAYKYVLLTEHIPFGEFEPNIDIISGQGIRLKKGSGVDVLAPPFDFKVKSKNELLVIQVPNKKGVVVTTLYTVF